MRLYRAVHAVLFALALGTAGTIAPARAQNSAQAISQTGDAAKSPASTVIVFDGSGSMWGKLDGEKPTKLVQAREAIRTALAKAPKTTTQLGLLSFGHRRPADCTDVQLIAPPDPAAAAEFTDRINGPLEKLNPKGKGPVVAALKEAAKALGKSAGPRSLVLVHDDPDNCQQDACAALGELQQSAPGVVIHVVGLGLKDADATRYQCLTKPTGGRHVDAQDGDAIASGISDVLAMALVGVRIDEPVKAPQPATTAPKAPETTQAPQPVKPVALATDGAPRLLARALLAKDVAVKGHRVRWSIWPEAAAAGAPPSAAAEGAEAQVPLAYGSYRVRAEAGLVAAERVVSVGAQGQSLADVVLAASEVRLTAPIAADQTVLIGQRTIAGTVVQSKTLGFWPQGETALLVPAGQVELLLEQAELRTLRVLDLQQGSSRDIDPSLHGGRIMLALASPFASAPSSASGERAALPVVFAVAEDDPDAPGGRREMMRSAARAAEFVVAPGSYIVTASRGGFTVRERITVAAGEVVKRVLPLEAARVVFGARLAGAAEPGGGGADTFKVVRLDQPEAAPLQLLGPAAIADLPPGKYRVEARRNAAVISAQQDFDVQSGEYKAITLDYQAGALRLDPILKGDAGAQGLSWVVLNNEGRLLWSSQEQAPTVVLGAGRYKVRMSIRSARYETPVEIRPGEIVTLRLGQP